MLNTMILLLSLVALAHFTEKWATLHWKELIDAIKGRS